MATGGVRYQYEVDDRVSEYLLHQVSKFVLYHRLGQLARDLRINQAEFIRICYDHIPQKEQIFRVLYLWYDRDTWKVKDLLLLMNNWQKEGYLDPEVWNHFLSLINPAALPADIPMAQTPVLQREKSEESVFEELQGMGISGCHGADNGSLRGRGLHDSSLRRRLKLTLRRRCKNFLSTDWLPVEKARNFPLREHYVEGNWTKKIKKARRDVRQKMERIHDIFENNYGEGAVNVLAIGEAETGKSCCMAMLASDWTESGISETLYSSKQLGQFGFVFFIELRYVDDNSSLERIIIKQHGLHGIQEEELRSILRDGVSGKVLLLLDGYDEYKKGRNEDIDAAIEDTVGNCFLILTSRDGDHISKATRKKFDGEIKITGLSHSSIMKYAGKYFESEEIAMDMYEKAKEAGIAELLKLPIILLMVCILYDEKCQLPKSQTEIVSSIIDMFIDRSALKHFGMRAKDIVGLERMLYRLGEMAWIALRKDTQQLLLSKTAVERFGKELLKLGLLHESTLNETISCSGRTDWLVFPHKLFQEYWAGYYASKRLGSRPSEWEINEIFSLPNDMERHWNVIKFTCGLMENSSVLIERMCEELVEILTTMTQDPEHEKSFLFLYNHGYLRDLDRERSSASWNPYSNRIICCMNNQFSLMRRNCELYYFYGADIFESYMDDTEITTRMGRDSAVRYSGEPCSIVIRESDSPLFLRSVLRACAEIDRPINYLIVDGSAMNTIVQEMYVDHTKLYPADLLPNMCIARNAVVRFSHCNFGENLRPIVNSLQCCTSLGTLELLYCRKIPEALISCLIKQQNLSRLVIREYHGRGLSPDVQRTLQKGIRNLQWLKHLEIHHMCVDTSVFRALFLRVLSLRGCGLSAADACHLLETLVKCPIEKLELDNNEIQGTFDVLSKKSNGVYPHLRTLHLERIRLSRDDIKGIATMINQGKLPVIENILLDGPALLYRELKAHLYVHNPRNTQGSFQETAKFIYNKKIHPHLSRT